MALMKYYFKIFIPQGYLLFVHIKEQWNCYKSLFQANSLEREILGYQRQKNVDAIG